MFMLPLFALLHRMAEPTPFFPPFFPPPEIFSAGFQLPSPPKRVKSISDPRWEKVFDWIISSNLLTFNDPDIPTFTIASLAVAPPLTFPWLLPLSPFPAHGMYFRTWVLIPSQFYCLSLALQSLAPTNVLYLQFSKNSLG